MNRFLARTQPFSSKLDIRATHLPNRKPLNFSSKLRFVCLLIGDILALAAAWGIARFFNQFYSPIPQRLVWWVWFGLPSIFWILGTITLVLFAHHGLYSVSQSTRDYVKAGKTVSCVYLFLLLAAYFIEPSLDLPRSLFLTAWCSSVVLVVVSRLLSTLAFPYLVPVRKTESVFLIARAERIRHLSEVIKRRSQYTVIGAAIVSTVNSSATLRSILVLQPEEVLLEDLPHLELASNFYWRLRSAGISLRLLPSSREMLYRRGIPEVFSGLPTLRIGTSLLQHFDYRLKRCMDISLALLGVFFLAPLLILIAIAIKISNPGPAFFQQERIGLHGKVFHVWKFRTMLVNAPQLQAQLESCNNSKVLFKVCNDPRIIPIGHFLRRTSLDELPQLFNVLLGQMSLVGPRPLPLRDTAKFETWHHIRHQVLPGITGLWQVSGRSDIDDFDDAARLDLHYIDNWSLNLDLEILVETIKIVCLRKGAY